MKNQHQKYAERSYSPKVCPTCTIKAVTECIGEEGCFKTEVTEQFCR